MSPSRSWSPVRSVAQGTALAVLAALSLSACGAEEEPAAATTEADSAADTAFPVVIEHSFGTTEIPAEPERVVTVGFNDQDFVLALGVTPVGTREYLGYDYELPAVGQDLLDGEMLPTVGGEEINIEEVAALEPDLIVGIYSFIDQETYDLLAGIAPVVAQTDDYAIGGTPWQEQTLLTGRAARARGAGPGARRRGGGRVRRGPRGAPRVRGADAWRSTTAPSTGTTSSRSRTSATASSPTWASPTPSTTGEVSLERLDLLDQDVLVTGGFTREEISGEPVFRSLAVVQEDRTVYLGRFDSVATAALGFGSPLSLPYLLDLVVPALAQAADGDPGTSVEDPA